MKLKHSGNVLSLAAGALALTSLAASAAPIFDTGAYLDTASALYVKWTFNGADLAQVGGAANWAANINTFNFVLGTDSPTAGSYWAGTTLKMGKAVDYYPPTYLVNFDIRVALTGAHSFTAPGFPSAGTPYPFSTQNFLEGSSDFSWTGNWQGPAHGSGTDLYRASISYNKNTGNAEVILEGAHNVPDAGASAGLLGLALAGLGLAARRKS